LKTLVKSHLHPSNLLSFWLASEIKTITANSAIPNDGIEQMARKSDGAGAMQSRSDRRRLPRRATEIRHDRSR